MQAQGDTGSIGDKITLLELFAYRYQGGNIEAFFIIATMVVSLISSLM